MRITGSPTSGHSSPSCEGRPNAEAFERRGDVWYDRARPPSEAPKESLMTAVATPIRRKSAPGPRGHWLAGNLPEFRTDRLAYLTQLAEQYGDCVSIRLGPRRLMVVNHPDMVEDVLV